MVKAVIFQANKQIENTMSEPTQQVVRFTKQASTIQINKITYDQQTREIAQDKVIVEQPLQISILWNDNGKECSQIFSITMRTPGEDKELIVGLLLSEGVINAYADIVEVRPEEVEQLDNDTPLESMFDNQWEVRLAQGVSPNLSTLNRYQMTYSSCGLCGTTSIRSLEIKEPPPLNKDKSWLAIDGILLMPDIMRIHQYLFKSTGGSHASALFDQSQALIDIKEDIGRHNALDKLVGAQAVKCVIDREKPQQHCVVVSGRISFEIVQKTIMAQVPVLIGVGAPSDLAIKAAKRFDLTLIGFSSQNTFNLYHGEWRLQLPA